jgi:hypothetical protein
MRRWRGKIHQDQRPIFRANGPMPCQPIGLGSRVPNDLQGPTAQCHASPSSGPTAQGHTSPAHRAGVQGSPKESQGPTACNITNCPVIPTRMDRAVGPRFVGDCRVLWRCHRLVWRCAVGAEKFIRTNGPMPYQPSPSGWGSGGPKRSPRANGPPYGTRSWSVSHQSHTNFSSYEIPYASRVGGTKTSHQFGRKANRLHLWNSLTHLRSVANIRAFRVRPCYLRSFISLLPKSST